MTPIEFNQKLGALLDEAQASQIPLGQIVAAMEITKIEIVTTTIDMARQAQAMRQARAMADQAPKIVQPG